MKHKLISWAFVVMAISLTALYAQSDSDFEILQNPDNTITITEYKGKVKDIVIPSTLYGLKVTGIGKRAFNSKGITSLVLPNTLISIDESAFSSSRNGELNTFTKVVIPNSVTTIGDFAFSLGLGTSSDYHRVSGSLTEVSLGTGVKYIGSWAFHNNKIEEINIPNSVISIGGRAFEDNEIKKINFGTGIKKIGFQTFKQNRLTELILPASIETIERSAFANNQLRSLVIPGKVTIQGEAFANNQIESITIPDGVTLDSYVCPSYDCRNINDQYVGIFVRNPLSTLVIAGSIRINSRAFTGLPLTRITIPTNKDDTFLRDADFEESFVNFYKNQNRAGKTYYKVGPVWTNDKAVAERAAEDMMIKETEEKRVRAEQENEERRIKAEQEAEEKRVRDEQEAKEKRIKAEQAKVAAVRSAEQAGDDDGVFEIILGNAGAAFDKKDWDGTISLASEAIEFLKSNPLQNDLVTETAHELRAKAYYNKKDYNKALEDANQMVITNPEAYLFRASIWGLKKNYENAIADCDKLIQRAPMMAKAYNGRGWWLAHKGDYDKAIADCNKAIKLKPDYAAAYDSRGFAYAGKKDYDSAIKDYTKALQLDPKMEESYFGRGKAYNEKGEYRKASDDFNKFLQMSKDNEKIKEAKAGLERAKKGSGK